MKSASAISSMEQAMICPRRAFLYGNVPGGYKKYQTLSNIAMDVLSLFETNGTSMNIATQINASFSSLGADALMQDFEVRAEKLKMHKNIMRYLDWESQQACNKLLAKNFKSVVTFSGEDVEVFAHRLFDRGDYYEVVSYAYKKEDLKRNGKSFSTRISSSIKLALMYLAGQKKLEQLRKCNGSGNYPEKDIYASIYYLKSQYDSKEFLPFDEKGNQIAMHRFTGREIAEIEAAYQNIKPDKDKLTCKASECYNCPCVDVCKTEFIPKKKIETPAQEVKPIDKINLTPQQRKFVEFTNGECRVNAVAGSGKTMIITLRTLNLIEDGTKPEEILMLTFTDKACGEMRDRIRRYLSGSACKDMKVNLDALTISTFNGWGQMILSEHYQKLGFQEEPQIIDDIQKKDIIIGILNKHNNIPRLNYAEPFLDTPNAMGAVVEMSKILDSMKAAHVETVADVLRVPRLLSAHQKVAGELLEIYKEYNETLVSKNLIDFEDQLRLILKLRPYGVFAAFPYKHIIIDEFQDSNPNQIDLIRQVMDSNPNIQSLAVVGDEMQAIYGFRDASPENLVQFNKYFPNMKDFLLEENFRSASPIIQLANRILERESRLKSVMKAQRQNSKVTPVLINKDDLKDELAFTVSVIKDWIAEGLELSSMAILGRSRSELAHYEKALNENGIPTIMRVPEILKDTPYVKGILAFARWLDDPNQMMAFALYAKMVGQDPYDTKALMDSAKVVQATFDAAATSEDKIGLFYQYIAPAKEDYLGEYFIKSLQEVKSIHCFEDLIQYCVKYHRYGIKQQHSTTKEAADAVTLITVHSAKGLEFDNCIMSLRKYKELDEEKRILYVAVTRARDRLVITYPQNQGLIRLLKD